MEEQVNYPQRVKAQNPQRAKDRNPQRVSIQNPQRVKAQFQKTRLILSKPSRFILSESTRLILSEPSKPILLYLQVLNRKIFFFKVSAGGLVLTYSSARYSYKHLYKVYFYREKSVILIRGQCQPLLNDISSLVQKQ